MNDDKRPSPDTIAPSTRTPNRGYRRTPPVIEGEASSIEPAPTPQNAPAEGDRPAADGAVREGEPAQTPAAEAATEPLRNAPADTVNQTGGETPSSESVQAASAPAPGAAVPPQAAERDPPARGYGLGALAAASLGSAVLAAMAVFALQTFSTPSGPTTAALETRISDIERRAAQSVPTQPISPEHLANLEKRVASVEALASGAAETARKAADAAARPAQAQPDPATQAGGPPQMALDALAGRIGELEKNATGAVTLLDKRLAAVETSLAAPKANDRATESRVEAAPPPDLDPLRKQIVAIEQRLKTIEGQNAPLVDAARASGQRLSRLEEQVQPLAGSIEASRTQGATEIKNAQALAERSADATRVTLAQSIFAAIETGAGISAQMEALKRLGAPSDRLSALADASKGGIATVGELERAIEALRPKIVAHVEAAADASVVERLRNSALGLVRVRPTGETTGDAPTDIYARIVRALRAGDVAAAMKEWSALPEGARAASAEWAKRAKERLEAEAAARALLSDATQKLSRS